ncbi:MAG: hypothetical protein ACI9FZ_000411 [Bacteroidia bacterium]
MKHIILIALSLFIFTFSLNVVKPEKRGSLTNKERLKINPIRTTLILTPSNQRRREKKRSSETTLKKPETWPTAAIRPKPDEKKISGFDCKGFEAHGFSRNSRCRISYYLVSDRCFIPRLISASPQ